MTFLDFYRLSFYCVLLRVNKHCIKPWFGPNRQHKIVYTNKIQFTCICVSRSWSVKFQWIPMLCCMMTWSNGNIFRVTGPFVRGIHRSPVNSPLKGQRRRALMFSLICAWINGGVNNREAGDLGRHRCHYDAIVVEWNQLSYEDI